MTADTDLQAPEAERDEYKALAERREPISHAEFSRFVQEAKDQRDRAECAEAALLNVQRAAGDVLERSIGFSRLDGRPTHPLAPSLHRAILKLQDALAAAQPTATATASEGEGER